MLISVSEAISAAVSCPCPLGLIFHWQKVNNFTLVIRKWVALRQSDVILHCEIPWIYLCTCLPLTPFKFPNIFTKLASFGPEVAFFMLN